MARFGDNMRKVAVTEGDKVAAQQTSGYEVDGSNWPALAGLIARVKAMPPVQAVMEKEAKTLGLG